MCSKLLKVYNIFSLTFFPDASRMLNRSAFILTEFDEKIQITVKYFTHRLSRHFNIQINCRLRTGQRTTRYQLKQAKRCFNTVISV